jgi:PTH1 family peptidyl-tRNA hydrolase
VTTLSEPIKLIVGLGNPGAEYRGTRHNAGADFVERLAESHDATLLPEPKFLGLSGRVQAAGMDVRLLIPTTFMNRSGAAVAAICQFYKIDTANMLVAHDELDFEPGVARFKDGGGHGGHNGLRDICKALGPGFLRLRIGIGHPGSAPQVTNYVLRAPSQSDRKLIDDSIDDAIRALPELVAGNWTDATRLLHNSN